MLRQQLRPQTDLTMTVDEVQEKIDRIKKREKRLDKEFSRRLAQCEALEESLEAVEKEIIRHSSASADADLREEEFQANKRAAQEQDGGRTARFMAMSMFWGVPSPHDDYTQEGLALYDKKQRIKTQIEQFTAYQRTFINKKKEIQSQLGELNVLLLRLQTEDNEQFCTSTSFSK